jgi:hypothetical protein
MLWVLALDHLGGEEAEEALQRIMGNRGPGVNPVNTNWGLSPSAQAALAKMTAMVPRAKPVVKDAPRA